MSTMLDLLAEFAGPTTSRPVVHFKQRIEEMEAYFDEGMAARLVDIQLRAETEDEYGRLYEVYFDVSEFEEHNKALEKPNYWDNSVPPVPRLTASEAGYYPENKCEEIYFHEFGDDKGDYFELLEKDTTTVTIDDDALAAGREAVYFHIATLKTRVNHLKEGHEDNANELTAEETRLDALKRFAKSLGIKDADI